MMSRLLRKMHIADISNVVWLGLIGFGLSAYMLSGRLLDTTYSDWIYHAFRAKSLLEHGIVSWDNNGNNGLSYWRGYQVIPDGTTAIIASMTHSTPARTMIIIGVALFIMLHIVIYLSMRFMGYSKLAGIIASLLSFQFSGYWLELKDYSIAYAVVVFPLLIALWHASLPRSRLRPYFALCIGLSVYLHPLLAVGLGGLWVTTIFLIRSQYKAKEVIRDLLIIFASSLFYTFSLIGIDSAAIAPYVVEKNFTYVLFGSFRPGPMFIPAIIVTGLVFAFRSQLYQTSIKVLYWYSLALYLIVQLSVHTNIVNLLNRFQLSRLLFLIAISVYIAFGIIMAKGLVKMQSWVRVSALSLLFGITIAQSAIDSSIYGSGPVLALPDPVGRFAATHNIAGSVHIADSTFSSYFNPTIRFTNAYNDQLLPQLVGTRYRDLLLNASPDTRINRADLVTSDAYARLIGVQYLFLPFNSPYIPALQDDLQYQYVTTLDGAGYRLVVLTPPWKPTYAVTISEDEAASLRSATLTYDTSSADFYTRQDKLIEQFAAIKTASDAVPQRVSFPAPDRLDVVISKSSRAQYVYLDESYSINWTINSGTITKTADNMMLLTIPPGVVKLSLKHTWGSVIYVQLAFWIILALYFAGSMFRRNRNA